MMHFSLRNGDRLTASFAESAIVFATEYGEQAVPTAQINRIYVWGADWLPSLVLHYEFRSPGPKIVDSGPRGLHAGAHGTSWLPDRSGAVRFDGSSYITLLNEVRTDNASPKSISLWFRLDRAKPWSRFFMWAEHDKRVVLATGPSGRELGGTLNGNIAMGQASTRVGLGEWHHAVWTSNGRDLRIYLNGESQAIKPVPEGWSVSDEGVFMGARVGASASFYLNGAIDDFMLFDRELQPAEITRIFESQRSAQ